MRKRTEGIILLTDGASIERLEQYFKPEIVKRRARKKRTLIGIAL